jgi:hypothetical protein
MNAISSTDSQTTIVFSRIDFVLFAELSRDYPILIFVKLGLTFDESDRWDIWNSSARIATRVCD